MPPDMERPTPNPQPLVVQWWLSDRGREHARCDVGGKRFDASTKGSAVLKLFRDLLLAGVPDQPAQTIRARDGLKMASYPSIAKAAKWTTEESAQVPVHFRPFQSRDDIG